MPDMTTPKQRRARRAKREPLTDTRIRRLKKPGLYGAGNGLYLQVTPSADGKGLVKSWIYRFSTTPEERAQGRGRERQMGLGSVDALGFARRAWLKNVADDHMARNLKPPAALKLLANVEALSLDEARDRAAQARTLREQGLDPIEVRLAKNAADRLQKKTAELGAKTFDECATEFIASREKGWKNGDNSAQWTQTLREYVSPHIGKLAVKDIDRPLIIAVLEQHVKAKRGKPSGKFWDVRPETASRVRGRIERILDWAAERGYRQRENPARWKGRLEHALPLRDKRDVKRHEALPYIEIADFMRELREQEGATARALEFIILTAVRCGEALDARWSEVDFKARLWTIPGARTKTHKEHRVPLSLAACDLLTSVAGCVSIRDHTTFADEHVFPRVNGMAPHRLLERMGRGALTVHGFRSTFRDWAAERTNFPGEVAEMALGHVVSNKVEAAYRRGDMFEKRRNLMDAWAEFCGAPEPEIAGKVIPIRESAAAE
jgi:integrase